MPKTGADQEKKRAPIPAEGVYLSDFKPVRQLQTRSAHSVYVYEREEEKTLTNFFYKPAKQKNSPRPVLEALASAFCRLIVPQQTAIARAAYHDNGETEGIMSEEVFEFKAASEDRLTEEDLRVEQSAFLGIDGMETLDAKFTELLRKNSWLSKQHKKNNAQLRSLQFGFSQIHPGKTDSLAEEDETDGLSNSEMEILRNLANTLTRQKAHYLQWKHFNADMQNKHGIDSHVLDSYRIRKGLAKGLVASLLLQNDDLHFNNLTKYGVLFDFDMFMWPILYDFKTGPLRQFRKPDPLRFRMSEKDITFFPVLKDAAPFYWPTVSRRLPEWAVVKLKPFFNFSANSYPVEDMNIYRELYNLSDFIYHKHATFLRFILTTSEMYEEIIAKHVRKGEHEKLMKKVLENMTERVSAMEKVLLDTPQFRTFVLNHGQTETEKFIDELIQENQITCHPDSIRFSFEKITELVRFKHEKAGAEQSVFLPGLQDSDACSLAREVSFEEEIPDFQDVRKRTIELMKDYKRGAGSLTTMLGFFRHQLREADDILNWCQKNSLASRDSNENIRAAKALRNKLEQVHAKVAKDDENGRMHGILCRLLAMLNATVELNCDDTVPSVSQACVPCLQEMFQGPASDENSDTKADAIEHVVQPS